MKKLIYIAIFSLATFASCDRKPTDTQAKKRDRPVFEPREEAQSDSTVSRKDSSQRQGPAH